MSFSSISPGNQPNRLFISSDDAADMPILPSVNLFNTDLYSYNQFTIALREPVLRCDGVQVATFVQPNSPADGACIPDYQASAIGFCYYKQAAAGVAPIESDLQVLYLLSSQSTVEPSPNTVPDNLNRYFASYQDFVDALNAAAAYLANGPVGGPDVQFYYDTTQRRIAFRGLDNTKYYMSAGYNDTLVNNWIDQNVALYGWSPVPYGYTLNVRVGFDEKSFVYYNQKPGGITDANYIYPYGNPNLVRTASVTLRANFTNQSTMNSKDNRDVLAVIPMTVPFLGVNTYTFTINQYLRNVPDAIQQITIRMFDDQGQPFNVGNNVQTQIELLLNYGGMRVVQ